MSGGSRWIWRVVACMGLALCAGLARMNVAGYLRHRDTGDQAGFALGMMMLEYWLIPPTSIALVLGTGAGRPGAAPPAPGPLLARALVALYLAAGAVLFLAFPSYIRHLEGRGWFPTRDVTPEWRSYEWIEWVIVLAFGLLLTGSAVAVLRPAAARSPWFMVLLAWVGISGLLAIAALLGSGAGALAVGGAPMLALVLVVGWALRSVLREPQTEPAA